MVELAVESVVVETVVVMAVVDTVAVDTVAGRQRRAERGIGDDAIAERRAGAAEIEIAGPRERRGGGELSARRGTRVAGAPHGRS